MQANGAASLQHTLPTHHQHCLLIHQNKSFRPAMTAPLSTLETAQGAQHCCMTRWHTKPATKLDSCLLSHACNSTISPYSIDCLRPILSDHECLDNNHESNTQLWSPWEASTRALAHCFMSVGMLRQSLLHEAMATKSYAAASVGFNSVMASMQTGAIH